MEIKFTDNSDQVKAEMQAACLRALEKCGLTAEGYAKKLCEGFKNPTGNLRNSISHAVDPGEMAAFVGSNSEYGPYVETGTGIYAEGGGGRPTPWVYQDANGNWHRTHGNKPQPFIKPSVANHGGTYKKIIEIQLLLIYLGMHYVERGYITRDEYENLNDYLYKPYESAGGNGSAQRVMEEVKKLPLHN